MCKSHRERDQISIPKEVSACLTKSNSYLCLIETLSSPPLTRICLTAVTRPPAP